VGRNAHAFETGAHGVKIVSISSLDRFQVQPEWEVLRLLQPMAFGTSGVHVEAANGTTRTRFLDANSTWYLADEMGSTN
jgi:hypothetical protein